MWAAVVSRLVEYLITTYFINASDNCAHGSIARSVYSLAIVGRAPRRRVNVNQVGLVTHRVGFDEISHVWLVQHSNASHLENVRNSPFTNDSHNEIQLSLRDGDSNFLFTSVYLYDCMTLTS